MRQVPRSQSRGCGWEDTEARLVGQIPMDLVLQAMQTSVDPSVILEIIVGVLGTDPIGKHLHRSDKCLTAMAEQLLLRVEPFSGCLSILFHIQLAVGFGCPQFAMQFARDHTRSCSRCGKTQGWVKSQLGFLREFKDLALS